MGEVTKRLATDESLLLLVDAVKNTETVQQAKTEIQSEGDKQVKNVQDAASEVITDINQLAKNTADIAELKSDLVEELGEIRTIYDSVNKADKSKFVYGEWFNSGTRQDGGDNLSHTGLIKVKEGDVIRFKDKSAYFNDYLRIDTYTKDKTPTEVFAKYSPKGDDDLITYTIPNDKNIEYILVNFATVYADEFMVTVNEEFPSTYVPYKHDIMFVNDKTELKGTLLVTGDSICQGAGTNYDGGYGTILAQKYPKLNVVNYGISGTLITRINVEGVESIMDRIDRMQDNADFVILEGGVNDGFNGITLGSYTMTEDAENTEYNIFEFCGAVETMFKKAHTKWKNAIIFCLIPMVAQITQTNTYLDTLKALCKKWGVVPIDIRESGMCVFSQDLKNKYTNSDSGVGDGLHPNKLGYTKFYIPMIEDAMLKYI